MESAWKIVVQRRPTVRRSYKEEFLKAGWPQNASQFGASQKDVEVVIELVLDREDAN